MMTCGVSFLASSAKRVPDLPQGTQGTPLLLPGHGPQLLVIAHEVLRSVVCPMRRARSPGRFLDSWQRRQAPTASMFQSCLLAHSSKVSHDTSRKSRRKLFMSAVYPVLSNHSNIRAISSLWARKTLGGNPS